jgi:hypothetical protein
MGTGDHMASEGGAEVRGGAGEDGAAAQQRGVPMFSALVELMKELEKGWGGHILNAHDDLHCLRCSLILDERVALRVQEMDQQIKTDYVFFVE